MKWAMTKYQWTMGSLGVRRSLRSYTLPAGQSQWHKGLVFGANIIDHALMTYRDNHGHSQLLIVDMQQTGIEIDNSEWQAVGMQATGTATVQFNQATASNVGAANAYLERMGFWHGAAGIAACWYGATAYLASYLMTAYQQNRMIIKPCIWGKLVRH